MPIARTRLAVAIALASWSLAVPPGCSKFSDLETRTASGPPIETLESWPTDTRWSVALLADPQLHNYLGGPIRSNGPKAARALTRVARRPAVLNLLAPLVLELFIRKLADRIEGSPAPLLLTLGDATDVACTGEFDRFIASLATVQRETAWLAVHGNHDSFMAGNLSAYVRSSPWQCTWPADHSILPRETRWSPAEAADFAYPETSKFSRATSWAQACAEPSRTSAPMTKGVWTRRYLMALETQGVALAVPRSVDPAGTASAHPISGASPFDVASCRAPFRYDGAPRPGTLLAARDYRLSGVWHPRARVRGRAWTEPEDERCPSSGTPPTVHEAQEWRAFVVQSVNLGPATTAILIDTSIREESISSKDIGLLPGRKGLLGQAQLDHIRAHVSAAHVSAAKDRGPGSKQQIVLVGHHPWKDLSDAERAELLKMSPMLYISGHTHFESSLVVHRHGSAEFPELNLASVTDWPMEAALLSADAGRILWRIVGLHGRDEASVGCRPACGHALYEPLLPEVADHGCTNAVQRDDLRRRPGWKEHQVSRSEDALEWLAGEWKFPPPGKCGTWQERAARVEEYVKTRLLEPGRADPTRAAVVARCTSRAVAEGWRAPIESTCVRRSENVRAAASVAGFVAPAPDRTRR